MTSTRAEGLTLREAALIVGLAYLLNPVSYAEFAILPKVIIAGNPEETIANIATNHGLFVVALFCFFINFIEDIVIACAVFILVAPVNRALYRSRRAVSGGVHGDRIRRVFDLATVFRVLTTPEYATFIFVTYFGELIFMLWLLIFGWRIREPVQQPLPS